MKISIINSQNYSLKALGIYDDVGDVCVAGRMDDDTEILITRLEPITKELMDKFPNLKIIGSSTTGLDHINLEEAKKRGIKVISFNGNTKLISNITSTAEHTWGLILSLARNYLVAFGAKKREEVPIGHELQGKTLGIIGMGRLGKMVSKYAEVFGMKRIFYDPYVYCNIIYNVSLDELLKNSDIITIHCPLNEETRGMIGEKEFGLMKKTALLVNTARAEIVDERFVGQIAGYASDFSFNAFSTPHIGGYSVEGMEKAEIALAKLIKNEIKKRG